MNNESPSMFERRRHALVAGLLLLAVAAVLTAVVAAERADSVLQRVDDRWLGWMVEIRTPWLTSVAEVFSVLGGPVVMVPLRLAVIGALAWQRRWLQFGAFLGAVVTSELCIGPLKAVIDRPRPPGSLITTDSPAFPSGHAIAGSVTAIGLVVVLVPAGSRRMRWTIAAATFATLMAMSRTYLGAHWLSDVVAGACIGTGAAVVWAAALELARGRRQAPECGAARPADVLRIASIVLVCLGLAAVVALHLLRPELGAAGNRISEYAIGPYAPLMTVAFVTIGAGILALAWPLSCAGGRWTRAAPAALVVAGIAMALAGFFRTDADRSGVLADAVHSRASALATIALIGVALAWSLGRVPRHAPAAVLAIVAAVLGIVSPVLHRSSWTGVSQRLLWLALLAWLIVTACRLTPTSRTGVSGPSVATLTMSS
jgi:membrane-associated phospholipid phosphatase